MKTELELMKEFVNVMEGCEPTSLWTTNGITGRKEYQAMKEMVASANTPLNRDCYHYGYLDGKEAGRKEVVNEYNSVDELKEKMDRPTLVDYFFKEQEVCGAQEYERIYKISDYIEKYLK